MTAAIVFVSWLLACCLVVIVIGVARFSFVVGFEEGRKVGHDDAAECADNASRELVPYAAEHFDARGYRRVH